MDVEQVRNSILIIGGPHHGQTALMCGKTLMVQVEEPMEATPDPREQTATIRMFEYRLRGVGRAQAHATGVYQVYAPKGWSNDLLAQALRTLR